MDNMAFRNSEQSLTSVVKNILQINYNYTFLLLLIFCIKHYVIYFVYVFYTIKGYETYYKGKPYSVLLNTTPLMFSRFRLSIFLLLSICWRQLSIIQAYVLCVNDLVVRFYSTYTIHSIITRNNCNHISAWSALWYIGLVTIRVRNVYIYVCTCYRKCCFYYYSYKRRWQREEPDLEDFK